MFPNCLSPILYLCLLVCIDLCEATAQVRGAMAVEISLANPLGEPVEFEVAMSGDGLFGDRTFHLGANETSTCVPARARCGGASPPYGPPIQHVQTGCSSGDRRYELLYSPLVAGTQLGSITFVDERVGEFWCAPRPPAARCAYGLSVWAAPFRPWLT